MRRFLMVGVLLSMSLLMVSSMAFGIDVQRIKTGLNYINEDAVQPGYVAFRSTTFRGGSVALIDMFGNLVHNWDCDTWKGNGNSNRWAWPHFTADANLVIGCDVSDGSLADTIADPLTIVAGSYDSLVEFDWNGNLVWESEDSLYAVNIAPHHDWRKIWNPTLAEDTYMALCSQAFGAEDAVALGVDTTIPSYVNGWSPDTILEVNAAGEIVWRWSFADHFVQNFDQTKVGPFTDTFGEPCAGSIYGEAADNPGRLDFNWTSAVGNVKQDHIHCNSIDFNRAKGHVIINSRSNSECYIIDHGATFVSTTDWAANLEAAASPAGDFIYRFGNPCAYGQGEAPGYLNEGSMQMYGAHNIQWIGGTSYYGFDEGLPGEGNLLIFDNGCFNPNGFKSVIIEWDPYIADGEGTISAEYVNPPEAGYQAGGALRGYSNQVVWKYEASGTGFYSGFISGCQRLPNGNTLMDAGGTGHFLEVLPGGPAAAQVVWEYFTPEAAYLNDASTMNHATFRCQKLPEGHPGLAGRDLTPKGNLRDMILEQSSGPANELAKFLGTI